MKKLLCFLLAAAMLLSLTACGGNGMTGGDETLAGDETQAATDTPADTAAFPTGLYMLRWIGDESGNYLPDGNEFEDYDGMTTLLETMYEDNETIWCEIDESGKSVLHLPFGNDPVEMDFNTGEPGTLRYGSFVTSYDWDKETGAFWFREDEYTSYWDVMEPCSQAKLDLVFEGKGGTVPLAEAEIGDLVCLGKFIQDEYQTQLSPIRWRVIDKQDGKLLLLSDKLLDSFAYNTNPAQAVLTDVTWENCSLRAFLNDESESGFLSMFTEEERALMLTTHLENKSANEELMAQWGSFEDQGDKLYSELATQNRPDDPDTDDRVFLLSYQEVLRYFGEPTEAYTGDSDYPFSVMLCNPDWIAYKTDAVEIGYYDPDGAGAWITRTLCTSHTDEDMAVYISSTGQVFDFYTYASMLIRPAVWVSTAG